MTDRARVGQGKEEKGEGAKQKSNFEHKARVSQSLFGRSQRTFDSRKEEQSYLTFFTIQNRVAEKEDSFLPIIFFFQFNILASIVCLPKSQPSYELRFLIIRISYVGLLRNSKLKVCLSLVNSKLAGFMIKGEQCSVIVFPRVHLRVQGAGIHVGAIFQKKTRWIPRKVYRLPILWSLESD